MSDDEKTAQAKRDEERRHLHFQVRLDPVLAKNVQHYADQNHSGVKNSAIKSILSKFFKGVNPDG
tara:strand:- start:1195 stop:1389 length:195 start_codon:yes stop_codon:yes gene_type:complete